MQKFQLPTISLSKETFTLSQPPYSSNIHKKPIHNRINSIFTKRVTSSRQCLVEVTSNIILTNMLFCNHFHDILRIFDNLPNFP